MYSGSSGNCLLVDSGHSKILVDCGVSCKKVCDGLEDIGISVEDIDAIFVTHEHTDHIQGIGTISKKFDIPIYANEKTWNAMEKQKEKISPENIFLFENDKDFKFNDLTIHPFSTSHDAANSCGFEIHNEEKKLSIATDLGYIDEEIISRLYGSSFVFLESNYDPEILKVSKYPYTLKTRIAGKKGHLSNFMAGKTISDLMNKKVLKEVMLGHLSKENNFPELAYQTVLNKLMEDNVDINNIKLTVASREKHSKIVNI